MVELKVPSHIIELVDRGIWPKDYKESMKQNVLPIVSEELVKLIAPDESNIYFLAFDSFHTMRQEIEGNVIFWENEGALDEIDIDKCMVIGDFGIGSDSPIILDYSENAIMPIVKRLVWNIRPDKNQWEVISKDVNEFIQILKLKRD